MPTDLLNEWAGCGRLDRPPRDCCYLQLPETFGRRFAVFVDTEEEFDWTKPHSRDARSTEAASALPTIHERFRAQGVKPVYLVDHPIASDPRSVARLRRYLEDGECTIGTQLHPWVNPPFSEEINKTNSFPGNLPKSLEQAKLERISATITEAFGVRPIVYRAGRYGVGPNSAALLEEAGYKIDVSVRPLFDYRREGGPDFGGIQPYPYRIGDGSLVEIPMTAAFTGRLRRRGSSLYRKAGRLPLLKSILARAGLLARVALTPEGMPVEEVKEAVDLLLEDGLQLFSISFHSPSLVPGNTPYVRTARDLDLFYAWWEQMFDHFSRRGIAPASLEDIVEAASAARPLRS